jgi:hypothetical protein
MQYQNLLSNTYVLNGNLTHAYLSSNTVSTQDQLISTASFIEEKSKDNLFVIHPTHNINTGIFCQKKEKKLTIQVKNVITVLMKKFKLP